MFRKNILLVLFCQLAFLNHSFASNNDAYSKGWDAFTNNNRTEARKSFTIALQNPESKTDALLSLSLLDWSEWKLDSAFVNFERFYDSSPNPYPYLYALFSMPFLYESDGILPPKKLDFFEKIVADPKINGTLKAMIYHQLGMHYQSSKNDQKAKELFAMMGAINNWQVLGSFDNASGSGFAKDWGAITKKSVKDVFKNKVDADVRWYTPTANKPDNWFYFDYYFVLNDAIMYAQSFVNSPSTQEVYLRIGTSGSLKIWVNDALVSSIPEERNCDLDIYGYKVKLNKGINRILVQIGQSEITNANFLLRLTDVDGNPISGLTSSTTNSDYTPSSDKTSSSLLPFFAEESLEAKVKEHPENILNYLALAETYLRNDKAYEATKILKSAEQLAPKSSLVEYRLAEAYLRARNQTDYDKEMENIKKNDSESFIALQESYNEAMRSEKYSEAETICQKAKGLYGGNATTEEWDLNIASHQKRINDVISMAKALYAKYPESQYYMNINYSIETNISKNSKAATSIVENYCDKYFNYKALETLSNIYFDQGNADKGLDVLRQRIEKMPYATGFLDNLAGVLYRMQKYKEALAVTDQMIALAPYMPGVYNTRGYICKNMNEVEKAKENFKKSIYYGPTSYDSRTQLRLLENKKEVADLFPKNDLDALIAKAPSSKEYPEDHSILLLNDNQLVVYPEGAKEYRYELAVKILNQTGIENWKEYNIGYNDNNQKLIIDKAEIIKTSGNKAKAETNNDNRVVFTNLEIGDVLHLDYRIQDFSTGELAKHFFDQFLFQYTVPSIVNKYSILVPKDKPFKYVVTNGNIQPSITDVEGMKLYRWESDNLPAVKQEPRISPLVDIVPTLSFSSIPNWKYVSNWYRDLTTSKFNSDYVLKETVTNILKGKENITLIEKAKLFYNYILENITYSNVSFMHGNFVPQKASRTITTRLGDCKDVSTLFVALCREAGISANLVLIATRDNGQKQLQLPSVNFNHCIAQLNIDGKTYYLELTDNKLPFAAALTVDLKSNILPIPLDNEPFGDKLLTMDMPFRQLNTIQRLSKITFNNNDMLIVRHSTRFAAFASYLRQAYEDLGNEERLKRISQAVASDYSVPVKVSNLTFKNLDNLADSADCDFDVEVKNALQDVAGMKILRLPWTDRISSLEEVTAETRQYPMEFWAYQPEDINVEQINIILPPGKQFVELPQDVRLTCANAAYQLTYNNKTPGIVTIRRTLQRKTEQVSTQEYAAFRDFINKVSENDNKQYAIK